MRSYYSPTAYCSARTHNTQANDGKNKVFVYVEAPLYMQ